MTAYALRMPYLPARGLVEELMLRERRLAVYGFVLLLLGLLACFGQLLDPRTFESGVNVWVKPAKFFFSLAIFSLTTAWFFGYVQPERRRSRAMRATVALLILCGTFELFWINWQAAQGLASHFNLSTPFHMLMFSLMGLFALILTATCLPLAWEIARRPAAGLSREYQAALVTGLALTFVLGVAVGGYMGMNGSHAVGMEGGNLPIFGWNRLGGDLRVAHFLGIHAQQAIPLIALLTSSRSPAIRRQILVGGTLLYLFVTVATFFQAVAGQPLIGV